MDTLLNPVQRNLHPQDKARLAIQIYKVKGSRKLQRVMAIVTNGLENAIFILKTKFWGSALVLSDARPILNDITIMAIGDLSFGIQYSPTEAMVRYDTTTKKDMLAMVAAVSQALSIACTQGFRRGGPSHNWVFEYGTKRRDQKGENTSNTSVNNSNNKMQMDATVKEALDTSKNIGDDDDDYVYDDDDDGEEEVDDSKMNSDGDKKGESGDDKVGNSGELEMYSAKTMRDEWVKRRMISRLDEYTQSSSILIRITTWNVNATPPPVGKDSDLQDLFLGRDVSYPELVVMGFQELIELNAAALRVQDQSKMSRLWQEATSSILYPLQYTCLHSRQYVGVFVMIFARSSITSQVSNVVCKAIGTGVMGHMGNKGAVSIRMNIADTTLAFVCSHLAAGDHHVDRRNSDHKEILRRTQFSNNSCRCVNAATPEETSGSGNGIMEADLVFWFGDLNYRIGLFKDEISDCITRKDWPRLYAYDQLREQQFQLLAFEGFKEGPLDFAPTYKFDVGTETYDTSAKQRSAAWCDRVLWKPILDCIECRQLSYVSHTSLIQSDHRPVGATFSVGVRTIIPSQRKVILSEIVREIDQIENSCVPNVACERVVFKFPNIRYKVQSRMTLVVINIGQVAAQYRFLKKPLKSKNSKRRGYTEGWLTLSPRYGMIVPGESAQIRLTVCVNEDEARAIGKASGEVEDIIVMHIENGPDFFISVSGHYLPTIFGSNLTRLCSTRGPARFSPVDYRLPPLAIPKELHRLGTAIMKQITTAGLFLTNGESHEIEQIRECLDTGEEIISHVSSCSLGQVLWQFVEALSEPLITKKIAAIVRDRPFWTRDDCLSVVNMLPTPNQSAFLYIIDLLLLSLKHKDKNNVSEFKLAARCAMAVFQLREDQVENIRKETNFVSLLITPEQSILAATAAANPACNH